MAPADQTGKVMVGLSGGVDSSVAALLLHRQGHPVEGLFMKNWEEDDTQTYCAAAEDVQDARAVCERLAVHRRLSARQRVRPGPTQLSSSRRPQGRRVMAPADQTGKVMVGLSGGVDSSVAALLLHRQGHPVEGLFMKNWEEDDTQTYCAAAITRRPCGLREDDS